MSIPDVDPHHPDPTTDAELQNELRSMFAIDAQNYLQRYSYLTQHLQSSTWTSDIQELYRCVHTIKGGAVTIAAEAVLAVATALEDVLSDLRYLQPVPPLTDGQLSQILLEAGELLSGTLELSDLEQQVAQVEPALNRIQVLHQQIREQYLPAWNAQNQLHQEFAEQGLDLVVLDLEIALERTPEQGMVTDSLLNTAQQTLNQLYTIGNELEFAAGWADLLDQTTVLLNHLSNAVWRSQWLRLFQALKDCARQGGEAVAFEFELPSATETAWTATATAELDSNELMSLPDWSASDVSEPSLDPDFNSLLSLTASLDPQAIDPPLDGATFSWAEDATDSIEFEAYGEEPELESEFSGDALPAIGSFLDELPAFDAAVEFEDASEAELTASLEWSDDMAAPSDLPDFSEPIWSDSSHSLLTGVASSGGQPQARQIDFTEQVQIPVPLQRLDQSAQHLVDTLLASRMVQGFYQTLQNQIMQLVNLAQEGSQYITNLRQIQDDYAFLDDLRRTRQGPVPERYRQGYTTLNRLLETSLRLAELGAEVEKSAQQTTDSLQRLDTNLLQLQNTVEDTRRLPFQNLGFRARAILRDLATRFGKPAQLLLEGEQLELDVSTLRSLEPALLHLIRNAYAHGLEAPEERLAQSKPEQGTIWLSLRRWGNSFQLTVKDDGRGIDPAAVRARAEALGLRLTQTQTPAELLAVICQPGFSSETQVTEVAGRGVGMDVVAAQVDRLGGKLSLETVPGQGTTFYLQVPVPHLLVSCLLLQAGNRTFALPTEEVRTTTLFDTLTVSQSPDAVATWLVEDETGTSPALDLLDYWQPRTTPRSLPDTAVCVAVAQESTGLWLVADELIGRADLLISPLPFPFIAPDGLIGVSLQANGTLVPVLNAVTIAERLQSAQPLQSVVLPALDAEEAPPAILIVDDAALIRRRIEASLTAYGYTTYTCADGLEAWKWLQKHTATLIITDIEMPNMDGFTLVDRCRQAGITTPILVVSSRLSEEWFNEAKRLGATDYLTKGFSTPELMDKVNLLTC